MSFPRPAIWLCVMLSLVGCKRAEGDATVLFAAASTRDAVTELVAAFEAEGGGPVTPSFFASSMLAKQIEQGAPAALFLSASTRWMAYLKDKGLLAGEPRRLMSTRLALVAPRGKAFTFTPARGQLAGAFAGRLALGDPAHVPVGVYAKQALEKLGWWSAIAPRVVPAVDARAALAYVERGECAAGVVYEADARRSDKIEIVALLPADAHAPISYELAPVGEHASPVALAFVAFALSARGAAILRRHGFTPAAGR